MASRLVRATGDGSFDTVAGGQGVVQHADAGEVVGTRDLAIGQPNRRKSEANAHGAVCAG